MLCPLSYSPIHRRVDEGTLENLEGAQNYGTSGSALEQLGLGAESSQFHENPVRYNSHSQLPVLEHLSLPDPSGGP